MFRVESCVAVSSEKMWIRTLERIYFFRLRVRLVYDYNR
jgi:hypothetical protein